MSIGRRHRNPQEQAVEFRERHKLDYEGIDRLLGFVSRGRSSRRWEENGVPTYADTLMAYIDEYGTDLAQEVITKRDAVYALAEAKSDAPKKAWHVTALKASEFKVPPGTIIKFREKHGLSQTAFDRLFGFTSAGRSCRLWETKGAPPYMEVLLPYLDKYGLDLAYEMNDWRGGRPVKTKRKFDEFRACWREAALTAR